MYPESCQKPTLSTLKLTDSTGYSVEQEASDFIDFNYIYNRTLPQGKYTLTVDNMWGSYAVKDYTVKIYAKSQIAIHLEEEKPLTD
jgi:hypothetical protein